MTQLTPYLTFDGNCREAMNFYKDCFGGDLNTQSFGESPMETTTDTKDRIMHAELRSGDLVLMASDGMPNGPLVAGNNVTLSIHSKTREEQENYFSKLAEGGKVTMPLQDTFWGAYFGMLTDKFGMHWMFNVHNEKK